MALFYPLPKANKHGATLLVSQAAADEGDPEAQYALGVLYANLLEDRH